METQQTTTTTTTQDLAERIVAMIAEAMANLALAAAMYAEGLDTYGRILTDAILERSPAVPPLFLLRLEQIGRQQLDHRLIYGDTPAAQRIRKLPFSQQKAALDVGVEVLVGDGDTLLVQVDALTPFQARQAFANDHIRTLPEQRAWMETERAKQAAPQPYAEPFSIRRDKVEIHRPITLTRRDLARMLEELS